MASKISLSVVPKNDSYDEEKTSIMELPKELLTDIVCRLPISSLYNMKPLLLHNKELHSIISDPKFPQLYQTYDNIHPCSFIAFTWEFDSKMSLIEYDSNRNDFITTRLNMEFVPVLSSKNFMINYKLNVLASCNGWLLVCLWYNDHYPRAFGHESYLSYHSKCLINPITRCYHPISEDGALTMDERLVMKDRLRAYAFGYVPKIGKYKVVRFLTKSYEILTINDNDKFECTKWRRRIISHDHPLCREYTKNDNGRNSGNEPVVGEGSLYWLVDKRTKILKLDMDTEEIELVSTPSIALDSFVIRLFIGVLGVSLYIGIERYGKGVEFWVMEESWRKAFVMDDFMLSFEIIRVFDDGKILSYSPKSNKVYLYDLKDKRSEEKCIEVQGMEDMNVIKFVPSFLSL